VYSALAPIASPFGAIPILLKYLKNPITGYVFTSFYNSAIGPLYQFCIKFRPSGIIA
jgi:hypothetical protein